jgi:hypothetical protein
MWKARPTIRQVELLIKLLGHAILEIRLCGWEGKAEQCADIADAFHNLPEFMFSDNFDWDFFRDFLFDYQQKYTSRRFDYVYLLDQIRNGENPFESPNASNEEIP